MMNLCILLLVLLQSLYIMIRSFVIYLRDRNRTDARYLLGWSVCTIIAMIFITGEVEVEGKPAWMTAELSPWGWVVYNVFLNIGVLGMVYHGVGFSMVLTGENTLSLRRCRFFLGLTLLVMTLLDIPYQVGWMLVFYRLYGFAFLPAGLGYNGKIIYSYMTRAKNAKPLTKWRMRFSKWGCLLCLLSPVELLLPFKTWAVRPSLLLLLVAWTLFALSGVVPSWLKRRIVAIEMAPQLFQDALLMWRYITDRYHPTVAVKAGIPRRNETASLEKRVLGQNRVTARMAFWFSGAQPLLDEALFLLGCVIDCYHQIVNAEGGRLEKWVNQWSKRFRWSQEQTFSLIRATYLEVGWFWVQRKQRPITISEDSPVAISGDVLMKEESSEYAREIRCWQEVATMLRHITERWDGSGSPNGLEGEEIPTFSFPADHGPHPESRLEWWYYTGHLDAVGGHHFGYQLTFFRMALTPKPVARESKWGTNQVYMAHFALTDVETKRFDAFERQSRGALGLAGAGAHPFSVWVENWSAMDGSQLPPLRPGIAMAEGSSMYLSATDDDIAINLVLTPGKPVILHGEDGRVRKSAEADLVSYDYSLTPASRPPPVPFGSPERPFR